MAWTRFPSRKLIVIGVTGTNGKTTTANLITAMLEESGERVAMSTTENFRIAGKSWKNIENKTTAGYGGVHRFLRRAIKAGCTHAVIEVSSHGLTQHRTFGVQFDAAVLTNVTSDHLNFHGTLENYVAAKAKLFWQLAMSRKSGEKVAVLPAEDEHLNHFLQIPLEGLVTFGTKKGCLKTKKVQTKNSSQSFVISGWEEDFAVETQLLGAFNAQNILAAAGVCLSLGVLEIEIQKALKNFAPVPGRLQTIDVGQPQRVVIDYAHTPDALPQVLRTLRAITPGRVLVVFGADGRRPEDFWREMGRAASTAADWLIVTDDEPSHADPVAVIAAIESGVRPSKKSATETILNRKEAFARAFEKTGADDTVLLAGIGSQPYRRIGSRKVKWNEAEEAEKILRKMGYKKSPRSQKKSAPKNSAKKVSLQKSRGKRSKK